MHFTYCPHCGTKAVQKEIGDEGLMPYCPQCEIPLWDMFSTCIICAVVNEEKEIALIRQNYISTTNYVCIAGYMKMGESAEETACREVKEEIGLTVEKLKFVKSYPYTKKEMLMLGFKAVVKKGEFKLSGEVDAVEWVKFEEAPGRMREGSIAWQLVKSVIEENVELQSNG
ncbi:MAG: NUDIX domain-containing protein [Lachnospiraceae bacterium]|nr:NUDIX domain-containing protein [Lachnospiraceae bacterium]